MSSEIKALLEGLNKKELLEMAYSKNICLPRKWSKALMVELLVLNVVLSDLPNSKIEPTSYRTSVGGTPVISIKNLTKEFVDVTAVNNLTLEIMEGELFSLLGSNGAGKTTTINILTGIIKPSSGTAEIAGFDVVKNTDAIKKIIGLCPQEAAVFKFLNARENIELFGKLHAVPEEELEERMNNLLELLGLTDASKRKAGGYSGGMLRKLNLIIALIGNPKIAFLDEPTIGMDARARRKTWEFIGSLKEENKTVILTTHYIEEAQALSDRVGIIDYGKLIELGTPNELMERYKTKNLEEVFLKITGRRIMEGL